MGYWLLKNRKKEICGNGVGRVHLTVHSHSLPFTPFHSLLIFFLPLLLLLSACGSQKKLDAYSDIYAERPQVLYIAPLNDLSVRHALRTVDDSLYNLSLNIAAKHLYLSAADPLIRHGYYLPGPLASAQIAATEWRTGKQLRNDDITDYYTDLGIDAVLFITLHGWNATYNTWTVEVEYELRSARTGLELMHVSVNAMKMLTTDFKGNLLPLGEDADFARRYGCDIETAQRCRLVEILNQYVLKDLPSGLKARQHTTEGYIPSHPEYFNLKIHPDGSVQMLKTELYE